MKTMMAFYTVMLALVVAALPARAAATPPEPQAFSFVTMFSETEDWVGQGKMRYYNSDNDVVSVSGTTADFVISLSGGPFGDYFTLQFAAPPGQKLHPGYYTGAQRAPFREAGHPGIDIGGDGRGCNTAGGRFDIKYIKANASGVIEKLWMTYEQHCEAVHPALFGEVRIGMASGDTLTTFPDHIWWPNLPRGGAGATVPVTFLVTGQDPLEISGAEVVGPAKRDYVVRSDECTGQVLFPGEWCQVWLRFTPKLPGPRWARLKLTTPDGPNQFVYLDGFADGGLTRLVMNSDAGDYVGGGETYSFKPTNSDINVAGSRNGVNGGITGWNGSQWDLDFVAGSGDILAAGSTYAATRYPFNGNRSGMDVSGDGRRCNTLTGTFTVNSIAFEKDGTLRNASISFVQHCGGATPALHGRLDFRTPTGDTIPPAPVTNLAAARSADGRHAELSWTNPSDRDLAGVVVRYLNSNDAPGAPNGSLFGAFTGNDTTSTSIKVPPKQPFTAAVYAVDISGNVSRPAFVNFGR